MGTITLKNFRTSSDVRIDTALKDGGVSIDWGTLSDIKAWLWSDAQKALAGRCDVRVDAGDGTNLICEYAATKPQYLGVQRLIVQATYMGSTKTYDTPAFNFVRRTADQDGEQITIDDPQVSVTIEATDTSSAILQHAIEAALAAAEHAEHAASLVPLQVLEDCEQATEEAREATEEADAAAEHATPYIGENGHWWRWSKTAGAYVDTGEVAKGPTGNGIQSVEQTQTSEESEGENVVTVTMTDGTQAQFTIRNGKQGTQGIQGVPGVANAKYKQVDTLPTAGADTMDFIYLTPSQTAGVYDMSYTEQDGNSYTWKPLGTTAIQLSDYTTKTEFNGLQEKVTDLSTDIYGITLSDVTYTGARVDNAQQYIYSSPTGQYRVIPINPGDVVRYGAATNTGFWFFITKEFTFNPTLPYYLVLATGETARHNSATAHNVYTVTIPSDGKFLVCMGTPEFFEVNGREIFKGYFNLIKDESAKNEANENTIADLGVGYNQQVNGAKANAFIGELSNSGAIVINANKTYLVIKVGGGETVQYKRINNPSGGFFYVVKSFDFNPVYPYHLDLATGETTYHAYSTANYLYSLVLPSDAKYIVMSASYNDAILIPEVFTIDGKDVYSGLAQAVSQLKTSLDNAISGLNQDIAEIRQRQGMKYKRTGSGMFQLVVYDKNGTPTTYTFMRCYKKWDTIDYVDGDGNTQTLVDFVSTDVWTNDRILDNNGVEIAQGNTNFISQSNDVNRYFGDLHGNEVTTFSKFYADGVEFDPLDLVEGAYHYCRDFRMIRKSNMFKPSSDGTQYASGAFPVFDTDGNPIVYFEHWLDSLFTTDNEVIIDNRIQIKQNNFVFKYTFGAMLQCYYGTFNKITVNNAESTINEISGEGNATPIASSVNLSATPNIYGSKAIYYGGNFVVTQEAEVDGGGTPNLHLEFYADRLKTYFMPVKCSGFKAGTYDADVFNEGDVIRVRAYRKLDIKPEE